MLIYESMESMFASAMTGSVVRSSNPSLFYQPSVIDNWKKREGNPGGLKIEENRLFS